MKVIGFDFGTTNSLMALAGDKDVEIFLDISDRPTPSVVCYEGQEIIVGREAKNRLTGAGIGLVGNVVRSPKSLLDTKADGITVQGKELQPSEIVAEVVRHVLSEARNTPEREKALEDVDSAVVTLPVNMKGRGRRALRAAFKMAGLEIRQFVHEPLAALYAYFRKDGLERALEQYEGRLLLVVDWGGGTLDLTLCRLVSGMLFQLKNGGTQEVGGDHFDVAIRDHIVSSHLSHRDSANEPGIIPGAEARLLQRCERAKIDLSEHQEASIYLPDYFSDDADPDIEYNLTRTDFDDVVRPLVREGLKRVRRLLKRAGIDPEQVALILATGGMANVPSIRAGLHGIFYPDRVHVPSGTATLIAEGAAWIAADEAWLVSAKAIELALTRGEYFPVIPAGTPMPRQNSPSYSEMVNLYCTDPRDGFAKFQLVSPRVPGEACPSDVKRDQIECLSIKVDRSAQPFLERLSLRLSIDVDLVLTAMAEASMEQSSSLIEIHNLEFGISLPVTPRETEIQDTPSFSSVKDKPPQRGSLSLRPNLWRPKHDGRQVDWTDKDWSKVPGELVHRHNPGFLDVRTNPSRIQRLEHLYYQPCSICGRVFNDPACACSHA